MSGAFVIKSFAARITVDRAAGRSSTKSVLCVQEKWRWIVFAVKSSVAMKNTQGQELRRTDRLKLATFLGLIRCVIRQLVQIQLSKLIH